jgi:hypothetical protein
MKLFINFRLNITYLNWIFIENLLLKDPNSLENLTVSFFAAQENN